MLVDLNAYPDLGLIIKATTGVRHTSQAAGFACEHPEVEGFFVPLRTRIGRPELATLCGISRGAWQSLTEAEADALDRALHRHDIRSIRVDRSMLTDSKEAWVHVVVSAADGDAVPLMIGSSDELRAILIWPNRD